MWHLGTWVSAALGEWLCSMILWVFSNLHHPVVPPPSSSPFPQLPPIPEVHIGRIHEEEPQIPPQLSPEPSPPCHHAWSHLHPQSHHCCWWGFYPELKERGRNFLPIPFLLISGRSNCDKCTAGEQQDLPHSNASSPCKSKDSTAPAPRPA